jgi:hypothetical protein
LTTADILGQARRTYQQAGFQPTGRQRRHHDFGPALTEEEWSPPVGGPSPPRGSGARGPDRVARARLRSAVVAWAFRGGGRASRWPSGSGQPVCSCVGA